MNTFLVNHLKNAHLVDGRRAYPPAPVQPLDLHVGDTVRFHGLRTSGLRKTTVRAVTEHYALCAWSSRPKGTGEYAIISWRDGWRGPHGSYGHGATTDKECRETLAALEAGQIEMIHRNAVFLDIAQVLRSGDTIFDDTKDDIR